MALIGAGCDEDGGRLLVAVGTDFAVPTEMAVVRARGTGPDGVEEVRPFQLTTPGRGDPSGSLFEMPLSFIVQPRDGNAARSVRILIEGFARAETDPQPLVVARRNVSGFVSGRTTLLPLFLRRTCTHVVCPDDQSCESGVCEDATVDSRTLPVVTSPGEELRALDALADASAPDAAALDAGARDAALGDAGPVVAPDASVVAAQAYGDVDVQDGWAVAGLPISGDLVIAGSYTSTLTGTAVPVAMGKDAFVARIAPATGAIVWIHTLNGNGDDEYRSIVVQGIADEVTVAGYTDSTSGSWDFSAPLSPGIVVAKYGAGGETGYGGVLPMDVTLAADVLSVGPALAAGPSDTFLAWAGTGLAIDGMTIGSPAARRGFVAALHPEGTGVPGDSVPQVNAAIQLPTGAIPSDTSQMSALATSGIDVYVGGSETSPSGQHAYVAALSYDSTGSAFTLRWETPDFLSPGSNTETRAITSGAGSVYAAGIAGGGADLDGFLVAFDSVGGAPGVPTQFGGAGEQLVYALARDAEGRLWTAGGYFSSLSIGALSASAGADKDMFLACFAPNGAALSAWAFPSGDGADVIRALALPAPGVGYFVGNVSLGVTFPGLAPLGFGLTDAFFGTFAY